MTGKRKAVVVASAVAALGVAAVLGVFWLTPSPPHRVLYGRIEIGMSEADLLDLASFLLPDDDEDDGGRTTRGVYEYEGLQDGRPRRVSLTVDLDDRSWESEPVLKDSLLLCIDNGCMHKEGEGGKVDIVRIKTGEVVARGRIWGEGRDRVGVRFDGQGLVVEKCYVGLRGEPAWLRNLKDFLAL